MWKVGLSAYKHNQVQLGLNSWICYLPNSGEWMNIRQAFQPNHLPHWEDSLSIYL